MYIGKVLNTNATTNQYTFISSNTYYPGTKVRTWVQIFDDQLNLRFIPPTTNVVTVYVNKKDGTQLAITATINADDRSMFYFDIIATDSDDIYGGNFTFKMDILGTGTDLQWGLVKNGLSTLIDTEDC